MITIKQLSKSYGNNEVLKSIDLTLNEGKVYGIGGENGAGKTTLFKCLAGLEDYKGNVEYTGGKIKDKMGFLSTDPFFFAKITGREYLQLLCNARHVATGNLEEKNIFDLPLNQYAETYSTGMKKKLAITGILLQNNQIFVLDEPFNGVDIHSNVLIKEIILKLKELNKIVLVSSHIFSTLSDTCDVLHLLKNGHVAMTEGQDGFGMVEQAMKEHAVGNKLEKLGLS